jgi:Excalibur calcium-binding domain
VKSTARVLTIATMTALLAVALLASLPSGATAGDKDCKDFRTQRAAQLFFLRHGGPRYDPDRLDGDNDGVACEDNPCPCYYGKRLPRRHRIEIGERRRYMEAAGTSAAG